MLTFLFSLFYVTGECHRFYIKDEPGCVETATRKWEGMDSA